MEIEEAIKLADKFCDKGKMTSFYRNGRIIIECYRDDLIELLTNLKIN